MSEACSGLLAQIWSDIRSIAWLEWAKVSFDLLKGVAWPLAVFWVVWMFRDAIRARIPFITQLGPAGAVFQGQAVPQQPAGSPLQSAEHHQFKTVNELIGLIQTELQAYLPEQRESQLVRALAETRTFAGFEIIFSAIFQSQLNALSELASSDKSIEEAQAYFEEKVRPVNKEFFDIFGFNRWSSFLSSQNLVEVDGTTIRITQKGRDFLTYCQMHKNGVLRVN
jgi:hypothetical protein